MPYTDHPNSGPLVRLIYRSRSLVSAIGDDAAQSVDAILELSRQNNRRAGITGVLLFNGSIFLQAVEGRLQNIEVLYETIACDQRHEDIELIEFSVVDKREYPDWSMAFVDATTQEHEPLRQFLSRPTATQTSRLASEFFEAARRSAQPNASPRWAAREAPVGRIRSGAVAA